MINISLTKFNWFEYKNEHFQVWNVGYVFFENVFYSNKELSEFFVSNFEKVDFKELLNKLSGNFAIIIKTNSKLLIISDVVRSYPLIYTVKNQTVQVYDCDIAYKKENEDFEIDLQNLKQYVCSGLVFGNKTIYKQVFGIQAAESVLINLNTFKISTERYYLFLYKKNDNKEYKIDINEIAEKFDKILINIFERIIQSAPNVNNWIIPLSGGHDSRLIAYYFHKLGIKNIICYSYGRVGSVQGKISKKIAENLGYKWEFIEIDNALVKRIIEGNFIEKQIDYSFIGSSTVEIQNFLPMFGLLDKNLISKNAQLNLLILYCRINSELLEKWDVNISKLTNVSKPASIENKFIAFKENKKLQSNFDYILLYYSNHINDYKNINRYFDRVFLSFKSNIKTKEDRIDLALFVNHWSVYSYSITLLKAEMNKPTFSKEEALLLAQTFTLFFEGNDVKTNQQILNKVYQLNKKEWCEWQKENFNLLRNDQIKSDFCKKCNNL
jgi:hypothetical protein